MQIEMSPFLMNLALFAAGCLAVFLGWPFDRRFFLSPLRANTSNPPSPDHRPLWMKMIDAPTRSGVLFSSAILFAFWIALGLFQRDPTQGLPFVFISATISTIVGQGIVLLIPWTFRRLSSYRNPPNAN